MPQNATSLKKNEIEIYDVMGKQVRVLADETQNACSYEYVFTVQTAGIYIVKCKWSFFFHEDHSNELTQLDRAWLDL